MTLKVTPKTIETTKNTSLDTPFTVYISGIDNRDHTLPYAARSDVNLIMVFNPARHQILVLNTPRDFYVPLAMNGQKDKLTHAGLYGVNESIHTLENFYNIKINYYARINFDATSSIVDQLGGVDITLPYAINTYHGRRSYQPGTYQLLGNVSRSVGLVVIANVAVIKKKFSPLSSRRANTIRIFLAKSTRFSPPLLKIFRPILLAMI